MKFSLFTVEGTPEEIAAVAKNLTDPMKFFPLMTATILASRAAMNAAWTGAKPEITAPTNNEATPQAPETPPPFDPMDPFGIMRAAKDIASIWMQGPRS